MAMNQPTVAFKIRPERTRRIVPAVFVSRTGGGSLMLTDSQAI